MVVAAVLTADRVDCGASSTPLQLGDAGSSGVVHLSPSFTTSDGPSSSSLGLGCGSEDAPWLVSAHPGQRLRVTLLDFDVAVERTTYNDSDAVKYLIVIFQLQTCSYHNSYLICLVNIKL